MNPEIQVLLATGQGLFTWEPPPRTVLGVLNEDHQGESHLRTATFCLLKVHKSVGHNLKLILVLKTK